MRKPSNLERSDVLEGTNGSSLSDRRRNTRLRAAVAGLERDAGLTGREIAVVRCLLRGEGSAMICRELGISPETLKTHLKHLFQKTGIHSRAQLVARLAR